MSKLKLSERKSQKTHNPRLQNINRTELINRIVFINQINVSWAWVPGCLEVLSIRSFSLSRTFKKFFLLTTWIAQWNRSCHERSCLSRLGFAWLSTSIRETFESCTHGWSHSISLAHSKSIDIPVYSGSGPCLLLAFASDCDGFCRISATLLSLALRWRSGGRGFCESHEEPSSDNQQTTKTHDSSRACRSNGAWRGTTSVSATTAWQKTALERSETVLLEVTSSSSGAPEATYGTCGSRLERLPAEGRPCLWAADKSMAAVVNQLRQGGRRSAVWEGVASIASLLLNIYT